MITDNNLVVSRGIKRSLLLEQATFRALIHAQLVHGSALSQRVTLSSWPDNLYNMRRSLKETSGICGQQVNMNGRLGQWYGMSRMKEIKVSTFYLYGHPSTIITTSTVR
ncbi:predicted protein [Lichtheimia corymbifera JMRC:FSU:9682]|uniref:Uncharacterized protein n=1 Tax=Lichtheimia corymbifera JMRC:FSU:9682 TaxID=1263082 RepID=A0A068S6Z0_9FUNG|nr:predicted protein [Lichtheimia corymbifera JMRC:FSU:9682]